MIKFLFVDVKKFHSHIKRLNFSFSSPKDDRMVEYKAFCFEIEKAFVNDQFEKNPLIESEQHVPQNPIDLNKLTPDELDDVEDSLKKISERVIKRKNIYFSLLFY